MIKYQHIVLAAWIGGMICLFIDPKYTALIWAFFIGVYARQNYDELKDKK